MIGAGVMGTGIAQCLITTGLPVVLVGRSQASADKALAGIRKQLASSVYKAGCANRVCANLNPHNRIPNKKILIKLS